MNIGELSINMNQQVLKQAVSLSVMKIGMNSNQDMMNQMTKMIGEVAIDPNLGRTIDLRV
ncbi:YjfB family protein [Clostridium sp. LP20]|uniref:YjfB family protein n=1 Tax=Clostridium sp. LP20 TaxID=3418665 RepID=UPI003EE64437